MPLKDLDAVFSSAGICTVHELVSSLPPVIPARSNGKRPAIDNVHVRIVRPSGKVSGGSVRSLNGSYPDVGDDVVQGIQVTGR